MMRTGRSLRPALALLATAALLVSAGCSGKSASPAAGGSGAAAALIGVKATEKSCEVSKDTVAAGRTTFAVSNQGSGVTEVYLYAAGDRVLGELENVGPGTKRNFVVDLKPGSYQVACKPGMAGSGIRTALKVTGSAASVASPAPS